MSYTSKFGVISQSDFSPSSILQNPHVQTILPKYLIKIATPAFVFERVTTPDKDFVDLAWMMPANTKNLKGVVVLFHGLQGSCESHYIQHLVAALKKANFGAVLMHFRGCSKEPNLTPKAYHSGAIFDPEFIIPLVKRRYPSLPLLTVGFSLGGNMLMKLITARSDLPIEASVCVSAPLDLSASSLAINRGFSRVYQWHLMKSMKSNLIKKMALVDMQSALHIGSKDVASMRTFEEFDNDVTAVLHGFVDAKDYYTKCSALKDLPLIKHPTLILHAADDPFMNQDVIPSATLINRHVAYELSQFGGHVGFLNNIWGTNRLWLPSRITQFFNEILC